MHWLRHVINDGPYLSIFLFFSWITYRYMMNYMIYLIFFVFNIYIYIWIIWYYIVFYFSILYKIIIFYIILNHTMFCDASFWLFRITHTISLYFISLHISFSCINCTQFTPTFFHITFLITQTAHVYCTRRVV